MLRHAIAALAAVMLIAPAVSVADDLTRIIQEDLVTLGYEPGNTDGEATVETAIAISKFQADHDIEVTGEASPQLAGIVKAAIRERDNGGTLTLASAEPAAPAAAPAPQPAAARDPAELLAAQQACLQQRAAEAQEQNQRRRGFARLARAVSRTASRLGGDGISRDISRLSSDVYTAGAIAGDFKGAAEDLGLTEDDIEACRNP